MWDEDEMSFAAQLITELEHSGLCEIKQLAFWSGLHENTVRDYRDGRIKHFGRETRFWNSVLVGLCAHHAPAIPAVAFRIAAMLLKGTPLSAVTIQGWKQSVAPLSTVLSNFIPAQEDLIAAMKSAVQILEDNRVDVSDSPDIAELNNKIDQAISRLWQIKHVIAKEREKAVSQ